MIELTPSERAMLDRFGKLEAPVGPSLALLIARHGKLRGEVYTAPSLRYGDAGKCRINVYTQAWIDRGPPNRDDTRLASGDDFISLIAHRDGVEYLAAREIFMEILADMSRGLYE